jgi:hypothetical protein
MITQIELKELLSYDPETGIFKWLPRPRSSRIKYEAGHKMTNGYITIRIKNKQYLAHRLAFLYMTGKFPDKCVDHIDRVRDNNRWDNLREVTPQENSFNRRSIREIPLGIYMTARQGCPGVWYQTKIQKDGKQQSSYFRNLIDAIEWRQRKERELFGTFVQQR